MDKVGKRKSRAKSKSKSKAKRTEPKVEQASGGHSLPQPLPPAVASVQNQLAYINNLSLMNRVHPRMFLASNMQDRIDYKTQESIENGDIRERIKMLYEAQTLQNQHLMQLGQGMMMHQSDMRTMMQNNSIAPAATGAHPVQNHLQDRFSTPEYMPAADLAIEDQSSFTDPFDSGEEIDGDAAPDNVTQAIGMVQETDDLRKLYEESGFTTEAVLFNQLGGMKMNNIYAMMDDPNIMTQKQKNRLIKKYNMSKQMKKFKNGFTINDFAKDFIKYENS